MATDISKIKLPNGSKYDIKDANARSRLSSVESDISNIQSAVSSALKLKGVVSTAAGITGLTNYKAGDCYKATAAFTIANVGTVESGDMIICITSSATYNASHWTVIQNNVDVFSGASTSADGARGLVPGPGKGAANRYLRSDGTWQVPPDNDTTYSQGTGITISSNTISNAGVRSVSESSTNGKISVNTNGTSTDVPVHGLGNAAYKGVDTTVTANSTNLITSGAVNTKVNNYLPLSGGTMTGSIKSSNADFSINPINGYIEGAWLRTTAASESTNYSSIPVLQGGWLYKRDKANFMSDIKADIGIKSMTVPITTANWSGSGSNYTYTYSDSKIRANHPLIVTCTDTDKSNYNYIKSANAEVGSITFRANTRPGATINLIVIDLG